MPSGLKRFGEKLKQTLSINSGSSRDWRPTSNARNMTMIDETRAFSKHLKVLQRDLGALENRVESAFNTMRHVLSARLPRAFDDAGAGVTPVDPEDHFVGVAVNQDAIASASQEMKQRLTDEVIFPLQQWLAAYRSIKASNRKVEEVRLDLDTKRRETHMAQERHARLQSVNHRDADAALYKAQSEEDKMHRLAARYHEMEAEVFNALLTLISDTAVLRDYQAAALAIVQRCFTMAYTAFDLSASVPMPQMPVFSAPDLAPPQPQQHLPAPDMAPQPSYGSNNNSSNSGQPPSYGSHQQFQAPAGQQYVPTAAQPGYSDAAGPSGGYASPAGGVGPMVTSPAAPYSTQPTGVEAPSWFNEAKRNARAGGGHGDSDSEDGSSVRRSETYAPSAPQASM